MLRSALKLDGVLTALETFTQLYREHRMDSLCQLSNRAFEARSY